MGEDPIQGNGHAIFGRTRKTQRAMISRPAQNFDLPTRDQLRTNEAVALVIERSPFSKSIETLQDTQFVCRRKVDGGVGVNDLS